MSGALDTSPRLHGRTSVQSGHSHWPHWLPFALVIFSAAMAIFSRGFLEPDEITHFLYARAAWHDWRNLLNIWGRPGCTGLFALAAPLGISAARLLAVAITALTASGTAVLFGQMLRAPDLLGHKAAQSAIARNPTPFIWLLFFAQPCVMLNSFTVMTEMLLACCWVWAAVMAMRGRAFHLIVAGALIGLGGLVRPEAWIAIILWPPFLALWLWHAPARPPRWAALVGFSSLTAIIPLAAWYLLGLLAWRDPRWPIAAWPWSAASQYGRSGGLFILSSLAALAVWLWVPLIAGLKACLVGRRGGGRAPLYLAALPVIGFFLLHGTLGALGLFGSLSLPRYFICVAPMIAILAVIGLIRLEPAGRTTRFYKIIGFLALAPTAALIATGYLPMQRTTEQRRLEVAIAAVRARSQVESTPLILGHPYTLLQLGLDPDSPAHQSVFSPDAIATAPPGTLLITDSTVWSYENRPTADDLTSWGYTMDLAVAGEVDAIPDRFEPLAFHPNPAARVRLWIKH